MRTTGMMVWAQLAGIGALALASCRPATDGTDVDNNGGNSVLPLPTLPVAEPPINREGLLLAVARAASAAGLGLDDSAAQRKLDGRRFEVRVRFGCQSVGAAAADGRFSVRFDEKDRTLRLSASPDLGIDDDPIAAVLGETSEGAQQAQDIEAVEGFWIRRPWLLADGCPAQSRGDRDAAPVEADAPESGQSGPPVAPEGTPDAAAPPVIASRSERVGLAEFFTSVDSRTGRRDQRAYEVTKVLGDDEQPSGEGYNLVLSGRLRAGPLRRVISCPLGAPGDPPRCIVSVEFDQVLIERPDSKQILAKWGS